MVLATAKASSQTDGPDGAAVVAACHAEVARVPGGALLGHEVSNDGIRVWCSSPEARARAMAAARALGCAVAEGAAVEDEDSAAFTVTGWDVAALASKVRGLVRAVEALEGQAEDLATRAVARIREELRAGLDEVGAATRVSVEIGRALWSSAGREDDEMYGRLGWQAGGEVRRLLHEVRHGELAVRWLGGAAMERSARAIEWFCRLRRDARTDEDAAAAEAVRVSGETSGRRAVTAGGLGRAQEGGEGTRASGRSLLADVEEAFDLGGAHNALTSDEVAIRLEKRYPAVYVGWSGRDLDQAVGRIGMAVIGLERRRLLTPDRVGYWRDDVIRAGAVASWVDRVLRADGDAGADGLAAPVAEGGCPGPAVVTRVCWLAVPAADAQLVSTSPSPRGVRVHVCSARTRAQVARALRAHGYRVVVERGDLFVVGWDVGGLTVLLGRLEWAAGALRGDLCDSAEEALDLFRRAAEIGHVDEEIVLSSVVEEMAPVVLERRDSVQVDVSVGVHAEDRVRARGEVRELLDQVAAGERAVSMLREELLGVAYKVIRTFREFRRVPGVDGATAAARALLTVRTEAAGTWTVAEDQVAGVSPTT